MCAQIFDVVVIGGGAVGENAAARAVRGGLTAALIEHERFGGECTYWACMPSKALLRPGNLLAAAERVPGVPVGEHIDPGAVFARRNAFTSNWDDEGQVRWARSAGIETVRGRAALPTCGKSRWSPARWCALGTAWWCAQEACRRCRVCLASPMCGHGPPEEATSASVVPPRLAVLGAGVVGVEMAQAWARLGSRVRLTEQYGL